MRGLWGIIIGATLIALNALVLGQEFVTWRNAPPGTVTTYPVWSTLTLVLAVGYTAAATTLYLRASRRQ